ncbi:MAG: transposase [Ignisphaera sp.]
MGTDAKTIQKTLKIKLVPLSKRDKVLVHSLLSDYTNILMDALNIVVKNNVRSRKKAHELCYRYLRERYPHLHNKYVEEAYKRALVVYRSYRKLLGKWMRGNSPSPPSVDANRVVDLHIDTFRIEEKNSFKILRLSIGGGEYAKFIMLVYDHVLRELSNGKVSNSKIIVDRDALYLLLTIRKNVEVFEHRNKLVIDINEDNVACLLVDYEKSKAIFFTISYNIRRLRENYRRIRRSIQRKVDNIYERSRLLEKFGARERYRVEDRVKKVTTVLVEIARVNKADIVRENLRDMKMNGRKGSRKLNYRLQTFPYRKMIFNLEYKAYERGLNVVEVDAKKTSITCPSCRYVDKENRNGDRFKRKKCGFEFNSHYVACLNLFSRLNGDGVAIRGGRIYVHLEAGSVVSVDVAPDDPATGEQVMREKPVSNIPMIFKTPKQTQISDAGNHSSSKISVWSRNHHFNMQCPLYLANSMSFICNVLLRIPAIIDDGPPS